MPSVTVSGTMYRVLGWLHWEHPRGTIALNPFAKLSARQWAILVNLVERTNRTPMMSRIDVWPFERVSESERVAALRAHASLIRRGLIVRIESERLTRRAWRPHFKLAVSPRAVLNAADDADVKSVDVPRLRLAVQGIEREAEREATRRETRRENERVAGLARRQWAMIQRYGPAAFSRDDFPRG